MAGLSYYALFSFLTFIVTVANAEKCKLHINAIDITLFGTYEQNFCRQLSAKAAMAWSIGEANGVKQITVEFHAATTGWVMFGINDKAQVAGSDVVVLSITSPALPSGVGNIYFKDAYFPETTGSFPPTEDEASWAHNQNRELNGITSVKFTRDLTNKQSVPIDRPITDAALYVTWAMAKVAAGDPSSMSQVLDPQETGNVQVNLLNGSSTAKFATMLMVVCACAIFLLTT